MKHKNSSSLGKKIPVVCIKCKYKWNYSKGTPTYRIRCPRCNSTKNNLNRKLFGMWKP